MNFEEEQYVPFKPVYNFKVPPAPANTSPSFERTSIALTPNAPADLTIEQILASGKSGTVGILSSLRSITNSWKKVIKKPTPANIVIFVMGVLMLFIWIWTKYVPGNYNMMMPGGIRSVLAFFFATFNNVPTRVLHFSALVTLGTAFLPSLIKGDITKLTNNIKGSVSIIKKIISYKKSRTLYSMIIAGGAGMFFANYMMRNCAYNKYFACLTLGLTVIFAASGLFNSTFIKLCAGIVHDVTGLLRIREKLMKYQMAIQLGFGLGLILSLLACMIRGIRSTNITENFAYILGVIMIVVGIYFFINSSKKVSANS